MNKEKEYPQTHFSADVIVEAFEAFQNCFGLNAEKLYKSLIVTNGAVQWDHDTVEEFLSDYRQSTEYSRFSVYSSPEGSKLSLTRFNGGKTLISVEGKSRPNIETVFEVFEKHAEVSKLPALPTPPPPRPKVFIGHGRSTLWRELKDHLQDKHFFDVLAYEVGARAGHEIRDILEEMLESGTFAILVMTGEDETAEGHLMPRMNVVHELGLFQGRLGFSRAIVLLEEGTQEFSNIHGTDQIRFEEGRIKETFGEVLATLKREFSQ
ncbi:MAG: nucleotide-binding protein [Caldilineaceae bacterium]|nr:nucleotide-binding protein [Caldilineaceae bacterium]MDE0432111.1 nucleotide-binding protein [Caldilineaceae bacterium]